jgi:hypothetical protein
MSRGDREAFEAHNEAVADGFISFVMGGLQNAVERSQR